MTHPFDARPVVVALAGPNGAGKSTFYRAYLQAAGLRFVNVDDLSRDLGIGSEEATEVAAHRRQALAEQRESFVFETVFSDPAGDKPSFLRDATANGYNIVLCFIGLDSPALSEERVAMSVAQGGHDVQSVKLRACYPRTLCNLAAAIRDLPHVLVSDNSGRSHPFRQTARFEKGKLAFVATPDVLGSTFGRETEWGTILIRTPVATLVAQGQPWTASPTGGSYGQSVPAIGFAETIGSTPKVIAGIRQDSLFRTNLVLANMMESNATVTLQVLLQDGTTATSQTLTVGPLGFVQLNLANNLGVTNFAGGSVLVFCSTPGCQIASYASTIDASTVDSRTLLAR